MMEQDMVSFVVRFVREIGEDQQARWRGVIKHVQDNTEANFTQFNEALSFMQHRVNDVVQTTMNESAKMQQANPFMETAQLWGSMMPKYTEMMQENMQAWLGQPATTGFDMTQQMQQAMANMMAAWGLPTGDDQTRTAELVGQLTQQINALNTKIAELEKKLAEK